MGTEFFGYTGKGSTAFNFRRRRNGIVVAFSVGRVGRARRVDGPGLGFARNAAGVGRFGAGVWRVLIAAKRERTTDLYAPFIPPMRKRRTMAPAANSTVSKTGGRNYRRFRHSDCASANTA